MPLEIFYQFPYLSLASFAVLINIPLGYIRVGYPKFSGAWLFWIHASIPFIIYLRIQLGTSKLFIPLTIALAVVGQIYGSRIRQKRISDEKIDQLNQIQDLKISQPQNIDERDVTVALLNMGGPAENDDVPEFQRHLFSDPLLIRFPLSFLFQKFFAWILITLRSKAVAKRYQMIGGGSPIYKSTGAQLSALNKELTKRDRNIDIVYSFNYSPPYPTDTIKKIQNQGKKILLPLSLYPHYSKATTGSNIHYLKKCAAEFYPELTILDSPSYYLHKGYIQSFIDRIKEQIKPEETLDDFYIMFSAHGLPLYFLTEGDPYPFQIQQTIAQILAQLKRTDNWVISYQSAVGPLQWLKPSTEDMIAALNKRGIKKLLVVPVSFVGDHIETICEIDMEYRKLAEGIGIKDFRMTKAIECHQGFIEALADSVESVIPKSIQQRQEIQLIELTEDDQKQNPKLIKV